MNDDYLIVGKDVDGKLYTWGGKYQWRLVNAESNVVNSSLTHFYKNRAACESALKRMQRKYTNDPLVQSAGYCTFDDLWIDDNTLNLDIWNHE